MSSEHRQIGEVANRTGLSLRTIRYYEEMGLVVPSARTAGGFRLYTESRLDRRALDAITTKYERKGKTVTIEGLNDASAHRYGQLSGQMSTH